MNGTSETPASQPLDRNSTVAAHRAHQSAWRERELGWPAGPPTHLGAAERYPVLRSCLAAEFEGRSAKGDGLNLMSPAAKAYADVRRAELQALGGNSTGGEAFRETRGQRDSLPCRRWPVAALNLRLRP